MANIGQDLHHYYKFIAAQPDPDSLLGPSVLFSLRELMQVTHLRCCLIAFEPTQLLLKPDVPSGAVRLNLLQTLSSVYI